jgi:hypothetical protein
MHYESLVTVDSSIVPGVRFLLARMSFGRRIELTRRIRELAAKVEFLEAGDAKEKIEATLLSAEIERAYVLWALREVTGLDLDGAPATPEALVSCGPEELFREALAAVKAECGLADEERKN